MNLIENPIFLTQKRLVHRSGVLAAVLIAALIGLSLLAGLVAYRAVPTNFPDLPSVQDAGKAFYAWTIGVEILVLIVGGFIRVARTLTEERKSGLWDSNRLTPLSASQIVLGYWLGPALREFYMALILAGTGLLIVVMGELPLTLWLGTQLLILSAALFFALLTITASLGFQRTQTGALVVFLLLMVQPFSAFLPVFMLTNFLVPTYGIVNSFVYTSNLRPGLSDQDWTGWPHFFGFSFPPILLSLGLQLGIGILLWRSAIRKTANPFQPLFLRRESGAIFTILLLAQHGLIWGLWHGGFPLSGDGHTADNDGKNALLPIIHCGTIFLAIIILAGASPQPETVRVTALRHDLNSFGALFSLSSVSLALILGGLAAALLLLQFAWSFTASWETYLIAAGNLLAVLLIFTLLLEYCRLRHRRRAVGFIALWLFVLCFLPLILAVVFVSSAFAKLSLLAPGVIALSDRNSDILNLLAVIVFAHFGIVLLLWILWHHEWRQFLAKASRIQN